MALTIEQIIAARKKYNLEDATTTGQIKNPSQRIAELRNNSIKNQQVEDVKKDDRNLLKKFSDVAGGVLEFGAEAFVKSPGRIAATPFITAKRGIESLIPGGRTGEEPARTIFGEVKPMRLQGEGVTPGQATGMATETAFIGLPVGKVFKPLSKFFSSFAKRIGSAISGKSLDVIETVIQNPKAAKLGLETKEVDLLRDIATEARKSVIGLAQKTSAAYKSALSKMPNVKFVVDDIINKFSDDLSEFGVQVSKKKGKKKGLLDFSETSFRGSDEKVLKEVFSVINGWKDYSVQGMNRLAVKIGNYVKPGEQSNALNSLIGKAKQSVRELVGDKVPQAKQMVADFAKQMNFLEALRGELGVKTNLMSEKAIIATSRKISQIFGKNKELTRELISQIEGGTEILAKEAGRGLTESQVAFNLIGVFRSLAQSVIPPDIIGQIAVKTGLVQQQIKPIVDIMRKLAPVERITLFNLVKNLFSEGKTEGEE